MRDRPHDEAMAELYRRDPAFAIDLLKDIIEDGDRGAILMVLRQMTMAFGGGQSVNR